MKATTLIAAAALTIGTAAFAQANDRTARTENASPDAMKPADDAQRTKNAVRRMGEKTRHAMHRAGDKVREVAKNDKHADRDRDRHARADRHDRDHDRHARAERHHRDDTRAMGAGRDMRDMRDSMRDTEAARRQRMDDAYDNWKARHSNG